MKYGLGKGLGALFSQYDENTTESVAEQPAVEAGVQPTSISVDKIYANPNQPRKHFDLTALQELADSIKVHGIIQPLVVNKTDDGYMIIAGERRYRASKIAGLNEVPVIVKNFSDKQIAEISIIENLQREDLNPIEIARGIKQLISEYSLTQEKVAERLGKSRPAISNYLRILSLYPEVVDMVQNGQVSLGHAKCLLAVEDQNTQIHLANMVAKNKYTVRDLERQIKKSKKPDYKQPQQLSLDMKEFINNLQQSLGTKVGLIGNEHKGRIYIDYYDIDDLNRIDSIINKN